MQGIYSFLLQHPETGALIFCCHKYHVHGEQDIVKLSVYGGDQQIVSLSEHLLVC
jgi:hypothetical protein